MRVGIQTSCLSKGLCAFLSPVLLSGGGTDNITNVYPLNFWPQDINKCVEMWSMNHNHKCAFKSSAMCHLWKLWFNRQVCWRDSTDCGHVLLLSPPECLYVFPCHWNYRPDHCMYGSNCKGAELEGVSVLHGNRGVYHDDKQPTFKALYEAIRDVSVFLLLLSRHELTAWRAWVL